MGAPGPNKIDSNTDSSINGIIKGAEGKAAPAIAGIDYSPAVIDYVVNLSTDWIGESSPYTQIVEVIGLSATAKIFVGIDDSASDEEFNAAQLAQLMCISKELNQITIKARGIKPIIEIPIIIRVVG